MKYAALDFELGNGRMISACAVGLAVFEDFRMVRRFGSLIRPPEAAGKFHWGNVRVHGIRRRDVEDAPTFAELWPQMEADLEGSVIVCHNAAFDTAVLRACLEHYGLPLPRCRSLCTVKISQLVWPEMENHKLNTVAEALGIRLSHHEAGSDAHAAGLILLRALQATGCADADALAAKLDLRPGVLGVTECKTGEELEREAKREAEGESRQKGRARKLRYPRRGRAPRKPRLQKIETNGKGVHENEKGLLRRSAKH